jgi:hypothetical protein
MIDVYTPNDLLHAGSERRIGEARTFAVLLTEAPEGGWGLWGRAHTNEERVAPARTEIAKRTPEATKGGV